MNPLRRSSTSLGGARGGGGEGGARGGDGEGGARGEAVREGRGGEVVRTMGKEGATGTMVIDRDDGHAALGGYRYLPRRIQHALASILHGVCRHRGHEVTRVLVWTLADTSEELYNLG
jgi:hypothetical protein